MSPRRRAAALAMPALACLTCQAGHVACSCALGAPLHAAAASSAAGVFSGSVQLQRRARVLQDLPRQGDKAEVVFLGRSNAGKSSLLNALLDRWSVAATSKAPGRTRALDCYLVAQRLVLVDAPGYGFARTDDRTSSRWHHTTLGYLRSRVGSLAHAYLLVDARRGLRDLDRDMLQTLGHDSACAGATVVLSKMDKLSGAEARVVTRATLDDLATGVYGPLVSQTVIRTSTLRRPAHGLDVLRAHVYHSMLAGERRLRLLTSSDALEHAQDQLAHGKTR